MGRILVPKKGGGVAGPCHLWGDRVACGFVIILRFLSVVCAGNGGQDPCAEARFCRGFVASCFNKSAMISHKKRPRG